MYQKLTTEQYLCRINSNISFIFKINKLCNRRNLNNQMIKCHKRFLTHKMYYQFKYVNISLQTNNV